MPLEGPHSLRIVPHTLPCTNDLASRTPRRVRQRSGRTQSAVRPSQPQAPVSPTERAAGSRNTRGAGDAGGPSHPMAAQQESRAVAATAPALTARFRPHSAAIAWRPSMSESNQTLRRSVLPKDCSCLQLQGLGLGSTRMFRRNGLSDRVGGLTGGSAAVGVRPSK